jgi:protein-disulfide isomerase
MQDMSTKILSMPNTKTPLTLGDLASRLSRLKAPQLVYALLLIAVFLIGYLVARIQFLEGNQNTGTSQAPLEQEAAAVPRDVQVDLEGWPSMGSESAPVVMVEYSDFACPFCKRFADETKPLIKRDYIDTGKVRFVYKDFIRVGGDRAAEAAHCASEQDKFWEYHSLLYARQVQDRANWSSSEVHRGYAIELGLNADALVKCFESRKYQEKVAKSTQEAVQNGGTGTPYFLINNTPLVGAQPFAAFKALIDEELK